MKLDITTYLKAENVTDGATGEILNEGHYRETTETGFERRTFEIGLRIDGEDFEWTMNKTSQRNLANKWGKDTIGWVGKKIRFRKVEQNVMGKMKSVLYADPYEV